MSRIKIALAVVVAIASTLFSPVSHLVSATDANFGSVNIYLFWGEGCPHCAKAKPFLQSLDSSSDKITLHDYEVYYNTQNQRLYQQVGDRLGVDSSGVPLIVVGDEVFVGYSDAYSKDIESRVQTCLKAYCPDTVAGMVGLSYAEPSGRPPVGEAASDTPQPNQTSADDAKPIDLPLVGEISTKDFSLPILTIIIAALDGFNPCAMWVLMFLISVLLGMNDRKRMWLIGGSFIVASAFVYFMFMTAWLNVFMFIGFVSWVKVLIGLVALAAGGYYLYDFYQNRAGVCRVTGSGRREKIFAKIRHITHERSLWIAIAGIVSLAFAVNLIELVCSAGLPAIYTGVLSGAGLPTWQYYAYMLLYVLVFMADDLFVFFIAMFTMKVTGVQSRYARFARLVGGILMLVLGALLIFAPQVLMFG